MIDLSEDEAEILKSFVFKLNHSFPMLVGYNIQGFDIPFVQIRCLKHRIDCSVLGKLVKQDLMSALYGITRKNRRLSDWYAFLGEENNSFEHSGLSVPELYIKKDFDKIKLHSMEDINRSHKLFIAMKESGLI